MRTPSLLLSTSLGAVAAVGVLTGTAWAAPTPSAPDTSAPTAAPSAPAQEPGYVSVSVPQAAPGQTIRVSGTCPTPADGAALPVVESVTSPAFTGREQFSKTDPMAFDGTATIARNAAAGSYPVTLTCSNGTAATSLTVTSAPTPSPTHHSSTPAAGGNTGTASRSDGGVVVVEEQPAATGLPWGWITAGGLVLVGGAAGSAYLISRRGRRADEHHDVRTPDDRVSV